MVHEQTRGLLPRLRKQTTRRDPQPVHTKKAQAYFKHHVRAARGGTRLPGSRHESFHRPCPCLAEQREVTTSPKQIHNINKRNHHTRRVPALHDEPFNVPAAGVGEGGEGRGTRTRHSPVKYCPIVHTSSSECKKVLRATTRGPPRGRQHNPQHRTSHVRGTRPHASSILISPRFVCSVRDCGDTHVPHRAEKKAQPYHVRGLSVIQKLSIIGEGVGY